MPRHTRRVRHRRGFSRLPRKRPSRLTGVRVLKALVAFGPEAAAAASEYSANGGGMNGISHGLLPSISSAYTGYNPETKDWKINRMVIGYVPILGAWALGKALGKLRVI
jgi:hypothetical protein